MTDPQSASKTPSPYPLPHEGRGIIAQGAPSQLSRVLEPEVMDTLADALDYDSMDHTEVNRRFVDDLFTACAVSGETLGEMLDLGTGTAQIPIEICRRDHEVRIVAVDLSISMLDVARNNLEIARATSQVMLDRVDAKRLPYADGRFAAVISNSIIHHIPRPQAVLAEAVRVTAERGLLFFRDLLRPSDDDEVANLVATYAGEANPHQRELFENSLRAALSLDEIREVVAELGFDPLMVQQTSDRHWTWAARKT